MSDDKDCVEVSKKINKSYIVKSLAEDIRRKIPPFVDQCMDCAYRLAVIEGEYKRKWNEAHGESDGKGKCGKPHKKKGEKEMAETIIKELSYYSESAKERCLGWTTDDETDPVIRVSTWGGRHFHIIKSGVCFTGKTLNKIDLPGEKSKKIGEIEDGLSR